MNFSATYISTEEEIETERKYNAVLSLPLRTVMLRKNYVEGDVLIPYLQALIGDKWKTLPSPEGYDEFYDQYLA